MQLNNPAGNVTGKVNEPKVKLGPKTKPAPANFNVSRND